MGQPSAPAPEEPRPQDLPLRPKRVTIATPAPACDDVDDDNCDDVDDSTKESTYGGGEEGGTDARPSPRSIGIASHPSQSSLSSFQDSFSYVGGSLRSFVSCTNVGDGDERPRNFAAEWDVRVSLARRKVVGGHYVKTLSGSLPGGLKSVRRRRRRIRIESTSSLADRGETMSLTRSLMPTSSPTMRTPARANDVPTRLGMASSLPARPGGAGTRFEVTDGPTLANAASDEDDIVFKVLKPVSTRRALGAKSVRVLSPEDDESETDSDSDDDSTVNRTIFLDQRRGTYWKETYQLPIDRVNIKKTHGEKCVVIIGTGDSKKEREIFFSDEDLCLAFEGTLRMIGHKMSRRTERTLRETLRDAGTPKARRRPVNLLIEVVSAVGLRDADVTGSSDPYVVVRLGDRVLHKTGFISNEVNPIWTLKNKSLFLVEEAFEDFIRGGSGVTFEVFDYDSLGKDSSLGQVTLRQKQLLESDGERMEFPLQNIKAKFKERGVLVLRCRKATDADVKFMHRLQSQRSLLRRKGVAGQRDFISPISPPDKLNALKRQTKEAEGGGKLFRVRPTPDPMSPAETEWMTAERIESLAYEPSRSWVEAGTGDLGRLYIEVLGCDGLPNMDAGPNRNNKTDAFVTVLLEDALMSTDVVPDCLSPRFLPWTRRAFVLHISHPTSPLLFGVHDWDASPLNSHDSVGRVAVELSNFAPNTEYVLHYRLYDTAVLPTRTPFGTITIRLIIEWDNNQRLFREALMFPNRFHVNVQERKTFRSAYYTIEGGKDVYKYSLETMQLQLDELYESFNIVFDIYDAAVHVVMWRGHFRVCFKQYECCLPLHSIFAFISGVTLVERPHMAPAFFTLSIGWALLALQERRNSRPSKWGRVPSYADMVRVYMTGEMGAQTIGLRESEEEDKAFVEQWTKKRSKDQAYVQKLYDEKMEEWEEMAELMGEGGDLEDLTSRAGEKFTTTPFRSYFYPYQVWFGQLCHMKRFIGSIFTWDHYYLAFAITSASLILGFIFLFIPWGFLFRWSGRLFVWVLLGPWMKLVDIYYVKELQSLSKKEQQKREKWRVRRKKENFQETMQQLQIQKENAVKLAAMKKHVFGHFIVSMPHLFKLDRYRDEPLPHSTAKPTLLEDGMKSRINIKSHVPGQRLSGTMIPENISTHVDFSEDDEARSRRQSIFNMIKRVKHE